METKEFNDLVENTLSNCRSLLIQKGHEYAAGVDRLANFKQAAALQHCSSIKALIGMKTKHTVSIYDMVEDLGHGIQHPLAQWDAKILDEINYHILLMALLVEARKEDREDGD